LAFSVLENIRPMIETVPLEQTADAYARMIDGKARFRMVLVTKANLEGPRDTNLSGTLTLSSSHQFLTSKHPPGMRNCRSPRKAGLALPLSLSLRGFLIHIQFSLPPMPS